MNKNCLMKKLNNCICVVALAICLVFALIGCGEQAKPGGTPIYFVSNGETGIEAHYFDVTGETTEEKINQMIDFLGRTPDKLEYKAPLAMVSINSVVVDANRVTIDFNITYKELSSTSEVLVRAAIVKTIVQISSVRYVVFTVEGEPLVDAMGQTVGWMTADTFIYNDGNAINTYDEVIVKLYFANESGDKLIGAYRDKFYSTNVPLEMFIVEELIDGPSGQVEGLYPTINPETNIISVSTIDSVCYVNLDSSFLNTVNNVPIENSIYSIVNSLTELTSVKKVQILINGEIPSVFTSSYERNTEMTTVLETNTSEENN